MYIVFIRILERGNTMLEVFLGNVEKIMYKKDMTQKELAEKSNLTRQTINKILNFERKETEDVTLKTLMKIAKGLNYSFTELFNRNFDLDYSENYKEDDYIMIFSENVKKEIRGKKQKILSTSPGIQESTVSDILNQKIINPKLSSLIAIAQGVDTDLGILFTRGGHKNDI